MQPPIPLSEFNVNSKLPDLVVEGDVMLKEFNFLVDNKIDKPVKIGRAVHDISEIKSEEVRLDKNICVFGHICILYLDKCER